MHLSLFFDGVFKPFRNCHYGELLDDAPKRKAFLCKIDVASVFVPRFGIIVWLTAFVASAHPFVAFWILEVGAVSSKGPAIM